MTRILKMKYIKRIRRLRKLTFRQKQVLVSIYWRLENFGKCTSSDLVGDIGVSFRTLADHLSALMNSLSDKDFVIVTSGKKPRNMSFHDEVMLTDSGRKNAEKILRENSTNLNDALPSIFDKIRMSFEKPGKFKQQTVYGYFVNKNSKFSEVFNRIVKENPVEPIVTALSMYTELDTMLDLLKKKDNREYQQISQVKLNIEIRCGRILSIAVPVALRGQIGNSELFDVLGGSWSWLKTVNPQSMRRYFQEATSIGLISSDGNSVKSMKASTTDALSWMAGKTALSFSNAIGVVPQVSLVTFKESFNFPTREEMLNPNNSDAELPWLQMVYDSIDKSLYKAEVDKSLQLLVNKIGIIEEFEGRLIPRTILRKISNAKGVETAFRKILKRAEEGNPIAKILLTITAKPGISSDDLYTDIKEGNDRLSKKDFEDTITQLANQGIIHISRPYYSESLRLYSFSHIPYLISDEKEFDNQANSVIKGMEPWLLSTLSEIFPKMDERQQVYNVFKNVLQKKEISFDDIEKEYGNKFGRKLLTIVDKLPFIKIEKDYTYMALNKTKMSELMMDVIQYSLLTGNKALGEYSQSISDIIIKDKKIKENMNTIKEDFWKNEDI